MPSVTYRTCRFRACVRLLVLMLLVSCGSPSASDSGEIRIGLISVLTGDLSATYGAPAVNAANLAIKQVNDAGGLDVGGRKQKVRLITEDDRDKAELATSAAQKLINQDKVVALISPSLSRNAIPVAQVAEGARIPSISPLSTNPATTASKQYAFRVAFIDPFQGRVIARLARDDLQAKKAAVLFDIASAYNKGIADVFRQVFTEAGGEVVAFESYTTGEQNFTPQLTRIKESGATVLFLPNYDNEVPLQAQQARQLGIQATLLGSDTWGSIKAGDLASLEGAYFSSGWSPDVQSEESLTFARAYRSAYGAEPNETAAAAYDAARLLFEAIKNGGKAEPEQIRTGLAGIKGHAGATGTIGFQGTGDPVKSAVISQVKGGKFVLFRQVAP